MSAKDIGTVLGRLLLLLLLIASKHLESTTSSESSSDACWWEQPLKESGRCQESTSALTWIRRCQVMVDMGGRNTNERTGNTTSGQVGVANKHPRKILRLWTTY
ncbi:hypothetical protein BJV82DRAFT_195987 [Fennellomyces sp. T-0311]|nr:hypothetical protein BJV82DRAFT_195987 [Fennellomyces sp. T-0311]